jgi:hypothetical protein
LGYALTWTHVPYPTVQGCDPNHQRFIGWQTRKGLAKNISLRLPAVALYLLVALLVVANTINIAADLAAIGEALRLVAGGPALLYALAFGLVC